jgi:hypothetical protein
MISDHRRLVTFIRDDGATIEARPLHVVMNDRPMTTEYYTADGQRIRCFDRSAGLYRLEGDERTLRIKS